MFGQPRTMRQACNARPSVRGELDVRRKQLPNGGLARRDLSGRISETVHKENPMGRRALTKEPIREASKSHDLLRGGGERERTQGKARQRNGVGSNFRADCAAGRAQPAAFWTDTDRS